MRLILAVIIYALVIPSILRAQLGIRTLDLDHSTLFLTNIVYDSSLLVLSGLTISNNAPFSSEILYARLDTNGTVLDIHSYGDSSGADYSITPFGVSHGMCESLNHDGFVLLGHIFQRNNGIVMNVAKAGNLIWVKEYPDADSRQDHYKKVIPVDDGYLVCGHKQVLNYQRDLFVMKIDLLGNMEWEKRYGEENELSDSFDDVIRLGPNAFVISGSTSVPDAPVEDRVFKTFIFAIDSMGSVIWNWEGSPSLDQSARGLSCNENGNWGYTVSHIVYESELSFKIQPKYILRDSNFELLSETILDDADSFYNRLLDVIPLTDGGYFGVGVNAEYGAQVPHAYAWMCRIDADGNVLWEHKVNAFPESPFSVIQYLNSAVELPGGSIVVAGYSEANSDPKNWGLLIKVTKDGCIDTLCTTTSLLDQITKAQNSVTVYPNPARDYLVFDMNDNTDLARAEIFDMTGRRVQWSFVKPGINVVMLDHQINITGLYAWRVVSERGSLLQSGKVMITAD